MTDRTEQRQTDLQIFILVIFLLNALNFQLTWIVLVVFTVCGGCRGMRMEEEVEHMVSEESQGAALSLHLSTEGIVVLQKAL